MKTFSNLSNINIDNYLKVRIPIMHRKILKIVSQNPEYLERFCNDRINHFHFAIRE